MDFSNIVLHTYLEILIEWIAEFYLIAFLACFKMEKKEKFILKYSLGILVVCALALPLSIFYHYYGDAALGRSFVYLSLFLFIIIHHCICYEEQPLKMLLFLDIVYLVQNLLYKLFAVLYSTLVYANAFGPDGISGWAYKLIYYSNFVVLVSVAYFLFIKKIRKDLLVIDVPYYTIAISLATVLISNILCSVFDIYIERMELIATIDTRRSIYLIKLSGDLFSAFVNALVIAMFFAYKKRMAQQDDIAKLKYIIAQSEKQYKISEETIESINIKCHDMKHKIHQIVGDNLSEETIRELNESITIYDSLIDSGNKTLDVILTEKSLLCDSHKITFTKMVDGHKIDFLSEGDIYALFGNILDNAIEATKRIKNKSKRYINLSIKGNGKGITEIECINYFDVPIEFENDLPKTIKEDKTNHGFGIKSIKNIVSKYNGNMTINTENNIFRIHIILFDNLLNK